MKDELNIVEKTPIEIALQIDDDGYTTARALYDFLELGQGQFSRWSKTNIENNEFYSENIDWQGLDIMSSGNKCRDYRITTDFAKHLCMESHSTKGKIARQYFVEVENKLKESTINRSELSPQMQMLMSMVETQAKQELEQKKQAQQIAQVENTVSTMQEIFIKPIVDWQVEINKMVREISIKSKIPYQELWAKLYGELEITAKCNLKRLCENKKKRMETAGNTKTSVKSKTTKLSVVQDNQRLKSIFENIVKRYAMAYLSENSVIA